MQVSANDIFKLELIFKNYTDSNYYIVIVS